MTVKQCNVVIEQFKNETYGMVYAITGGTFGDLARTTSANMFVGRTQQEGRLIFDFANLFTPTGKKETVPFTLDSTLYTTELAEKLVAFEMLHAYARTEP